MREALIETRKKAGFTQEQIANIVGIDRASYSHIERGSRTPSLEIAAKIAGTLNKAIEEIFLPSDVAIRHNNS